MDVIASVKAAEDLEVEKTCWGNGLGEGTRIDFILANDVAGRSCKDAGNMGGSMGFPRMSQSLHNLTWPLTVKSAGSEYCQQQYR